MSRPPALSGVDFASARGEEGPFDLDVERYEDRGVLGRGGMGEVRLVYDRRLDREVALKVARDPKAEADMAWEARLTAGLDHPGIVRVHNAGRLPDGRAFYTMPVLGQQTLAHASAQGSAPERLIRHLLDACQAVAHAHDHQVIHRDLKPANILLGSRGETQVADWGLATELIGGWAPVQARVGTPGFMAPEQESGRSVGPPADVYALGVMLQELLPGDAAPDLRAIGERATAAHALRYPNAGALAEDLQAWVDGRRVQAYDYSRGELLQRAIVAWRVPLGVGVAALLAILAIAAVSGVQIVEERDLAQAAEEEARANLARALVAQAAVAAAGERRAHAEILAAHALDQGPDPVATGVLARFGLQPRPSPGVAPPMAEEDGIRLEGGRAYRLVDGVAVPGPDCPGPLGARQAALDGAGLIVGCAGASGLDSAVVRADGRLALIIPAELGPPSAVAAGEWTAAVTESGHLLASGDGAWDVQVGGGAVTQLAVQGDRVAVSSSAGDVRVYRFGHDEPLALLPGSGGRLRWTGPDTLDSGDVRWSLAVAARPHRIPGQAGIAGVSVLDDQVAVARGDGSVGLYSLDDGALIAERQLSEGVAKDVAIAPDGSALLVAAAHLEGARLFSLSQDGVQVLAGSRSRRAVWTEQGWGVADYGMTVRTPAGEVRVPSYLHDLAAAERGLLAVLTDGQIFRITSTAERLGQVPEAVGVAEDAGRIWVLTRASLVQLGGPEHPVAGVGTSIAASQGLVAVGQLDGEIHIWQDSQRVATLIGHQRRVGALAFTPDGARLVSTGWDGDIRQWDLRRLRGGPVQRAQDLEAAWGLDLAQVLEI